MKIIVTGATGQYGRLAIKHLLKRVPASDLILTTRKPQLLAEYAALGASVRQGDFDDPEALRTAFQGGDRMLLISTARGGRRVEQHRRAIEAAVAAGVRHIAYTSVIGVGTNTPAIVKIDHEATENIIKASGAAGTFLRDSQYAEAVAAVIAPKAVATGKWVTSSGDGRIAVVAREDCVECAVAALTTPGHENKAYDITGPESLSFRQMAAMVAEISGRPIDYTVVTDDDMFAMFDSLGVPREARDDYVVNNIPWSSNDMVSFERAIREGYFDVCSDHVRQLLGRPPKSVREVFLEHRHLYQVA